MLKFCICFKDLRSQIDELQRSKENLERNTFSLLEEIKSLKSKVDMETLSINTASGDLRNKTRRLEDESRQQVSLCSKKISSFYFKLQ
jgi:predicted  nucleic acid-binding Zn-ribbon protein